MSTPFTNPAGQWNERYASADGFLFGTEPNAWLRQHAGIWQAGQRVLCVVDGEGRSSVWQHDACGIRPRSNFGFVTLDSISKLRFDRKAIRKLNRMGEHLRQRKRPITGKHHHKTTRCSRCDR